MRTRHLSCVILAPVEQVYAFAAELTNLPLWAAGLAQSDVSPQGNSVEVQSPMGLVIARFVARNEFGVLDHDVTLPSGDVVYNPFRVVAHPNDTEAIFTVRQLALSDEEFEKDCRMVADDLARLKLLVEGPSQDSEAPLGT